MSLEKSILKKRGFNDFFSSLEVNTNSDDEEKNRNKRKRRKKKQNKSDSIDGENNKNNKRKRKKNKKESSEKDPKDDLSDHRKFIRVIFGLNPNQEDFNEPELEPEPEPEEDICRNPLCDHSDIVYGEDLEKYKIKLKEIKNISDLIELGKSYHCKKNLFYNGLDLKILCNLINPLSKLNSLIGMNKVKEDMVNQIVFFLQGFNKSDKCNECIDCSLGRECQQELNNDMLHTVITGPPGVGKTELGKILGQVYKEMGVLKKGTLKVVKRSDLIGKYLGHTAAKTQDVIDECSGGVMFIDEAYSLGNKEGRDSFSKECLDTLNQNLTERRDFLCIIAGYEESLDNCFFNYNEGLKRRFSFRYNITGYSAVELKQIFELKVKKESWNLKKYKKNKLEEFFIKNKEFFPHYGGDIETFFLHCKIFHSRRVFLLSQEKKKIITIEDIENGFKTFVKDRKYIEKKNTLSDVAKMMYL